MKIVFRPVVNFMRVVCTKVLHAAFLLLHFGFEIFCRKNIGKKVARKLLMKLTPALDKWANIFISLLRWVNINISLTMTMRYNLISILLFISNCWAEIWQSITHLWFDNFEMEICVKFIFSSFCIASLLRGKTAKKI